MKYYYCMRIKTREDLNTLFNTGNSKNFGNTWEYKLVENEEDPHIDFVSVFFEMLESKKLELDSIGVTSELITFWILYEYDHQCNLSLSATDLKRIGAAGIELCISCWQAELDTQA